MKFSQLLKRELQSRKYRAVLAGMIGVAIAIVEGTYGVTGIHRLRDEQGNLLVWFASGSTEWLKEGETVKVKATIVSHDEFRGEKQTKVNRVAVV